MCETGGFAEGSIEGIAAILTIGPYRWDAHEVVAYGVETNRVGTGAYRAPGAPQATFALEQLIDELAAPRTSTRSSSGGATSSPPTTRWPTGRRGAASASTDCLARLAEHPLYRDRASLPDGEGVGLAVGAWPGGRQPASAICRLEADGRVTVVTGVVDMSGTMTGFATIAAEGLGLAAEDVSVVAPTRRPRRARRSAAAASSPTRRAGRPERDRRSCARRSSRYAALALEIDVRDLELVDGVVRPKGTPERGI